MSDEAAVWLSKLTLQNFRNHPSTALVLQPRCVVLTGNNGAGKTNLLEAISLLSPGRGMRRSPFKDMAYTGADGGWAVGATLNTPMDEEIRIGTALQSGFGEASGRIVRIGGETVQIGQLGTFMRVLWLVPAMDGLFTGAAGDRRRFLDRFVLAVDPGHGARVLSYEKIMRDRNKLLERTSWDAVWLSALEAQLAEVGVAVGMARHEAVSRLKRMIAERTEKEPTSPFPDAVLSIEGDFEPFIEGVAAVDAEEAYADRLADDRRRDAAAGRTLFGPHRSDLIVQHGPKEMEARLCSTGEQKALLIGLLLAHAENVASIHNGEPPLLLLDEIAAHLDEHRRFALFERILDIRAQAFMTGTDRALFQGLEGRAQFFDVDQGCISASRA